MKISCGGSTYIAPWWNPTLFWRTQSWADSTYVQWLPEKTMLIIRASTCNFPAERMSVLLTVPLTWLATNIMLKQKRFSHSERGMEREVSVTPSVSLAPEWPEPLRKLAKSAAMLRSGGGGGVVAPKLQYMEEREVKFYKNYYVAHTSVHLVKTVTSHICRVSLGFSKLRYQSK